MNCLKPISVMVFLGLTGCAGMSARFDCALKPGVHCKSISEVNTLVDKGALHKKSEVKKCQKTGCSPLRREVNSASNTHAFSIWMAPFKDAEGIQHSEAYLTLPEVPLGSDR